MPSATTESPFWLNLDPKTRRARLHVGTCSHAIEKGARQGTEKPVGSVVSRSQGGWVPFPDIEAARRELAANWPKLTLSACRDCLRETVPPEAPLASDLDYRPTERTSVTTHRIIRDSDHSRYIKQLYNYQCQICGECIMLPGDARYAEGHHLRPLGRGGPDHPRNIVCVCPNHHVQLDYFSIPIQLSTLKLVPEHNLDAAFIEYHNDEHTRNTRTEQADAGNWLSAGA